jgi:dipeptidyl aminopeptidase/acylaminoacyl peptidase
MALVPTRQAARLAALLITLLLIAGLLLPGGAARSQMATPIPTPTPPAPFDDSLDGTLDTITLIHYTSRSAYYAITYWSDGLRVAGFLGVPLGPGPYPAIIHNRGGYGEVGWQTVVEIVPLVEAGYVAVASQYRGNGGSEGHEDFGGNDVHDVTNLITLLKSLPDVDPDRIGMMGGSRGGMMTYIALKIDTLSGQNDIKAAVTVGAMSNLLLWDQEVGARNGYDSLLWLPLIGATPAQAPERFIARSAVYWPDLINAPLLLLHGAADDSVPVRHTLMLADRLKQAGKTVSVIIYPGGDHPLTYEQGGMPDALAWFGLYLGGDGVDRSYATHAADINTVQAWFLAQPPYR